MSGRCLPHGPQVCKCGSGFVNYSIARRVFSEITLDVVVEPAEREWHVCPFNTSDRFDYVSEFVSIGCGCGSPIFLPSFRHRNTFIPYTGCINITYIHIHIYLTHKRSKIRIGTRTLLKRVQRLLFSRTPPGNRRGVVEAVVRIFRVGRRLKIYWHRLSTQVILWGV